MYIHWWVRWKVKFDILKEPLGEEEKIYLSRVRLGLSEEQWEVPDNFKQNCCIAFNISVLLFLSWHQINLHKGDTITNNFNVEVVLFLELRVIG